MKQSASQAHSRSSDLLKSYPLYPEIDLPFLMEHFGKESPTVANKSS